MTAQLTAAWRGGDSLGRPGWNLQFGFSETTIAALKRAIPAEARSWDADDKVWWVRADYESVVLAIFPAFPAFRDQPALFTL